MTIFTYSAAVFLVSSFLISFCTPAYSDEAAGRFLFERKCSNCHAIGQVADKKIGPPLNNIIGSGIGSQNFDYGERLRKLSQGRVWDSGRLISYMRNPHNYRNGYVGDFGSIGDLRDHEDILLYLSKFSNNQEAVSELLEPKDCEILGNEILRIKDNASIGGVSLPVDAAFRLELNKLPDGKYQLLLISNIGIEFGGTGIASFYTRYLNSLLPPKTCEDRPAIETHSTMQSPNTIRLSTRFEFQKWACENVWITTFKTRLLRLTGGFEHDLTLSIEDNNILFNSKLISSTVEAGLFNAKCLMVVWGIPKAVFV